MKILGIESSCDETASAIVKNGTKILKSSLASSVKIHAKTGGIIPENAARQQIQSIIPVINQVVKKKTEIDAIAVTVGPGLIGSLLIGIETAKTLSFLWDKPIIPINHLIAHIYANFVDRNILPKFPAISLVVSGGHTDLVLLKNHGKITHLGSTRDDAAGEAFDKTARILGLPYPGGPNLAKLADQYLKKNPQFKANLLPRPMIKSNNFEFSFSGLKTAVNREVDKNYKLKKDRLAAEIQEAIVEVLVSKTIKALNKYKPRSILLAGGVSANLRLRKTFEEKINKKTKLFYPPISLCTDNAVAIASCAFFNQNFRHWKEIKANPQLTIMDEV